jgi:hypothetical protein
VTYQPLEDGYCVDCGAISPESLCEECALEQQHPAGREGFDGIVDRLMFEHGLDRDEAEARAERILEDDAA